jgi:uncharacterized membrane protein YjjP (DUF1212 family)
MDYEWFIPWFPVLVILSYIPFLIRMDLKDRDIPHETWVGMLPMFIVTGYLYAIGYYPMEMMALSFIFVAIFFAAMKLGAFEGADFIFLAFISLFFVVNPLSGRILMPLVLAEFLLAVFVSINLVAFAIKRKYEQFPMIPVIAAAFVLSVVLG